MKNKTILISIILLILGLVYYFSFTFILSSTTNKLLQQQIETSKNQAELISNILSTKIDKGTNKEEIISDLQKSIQNMSTTNSFICMFDNTGKEICHPIKERIGKTLSDNNSVIQLGSNFEIENNFKNAIINKKPTGGIRKSNKHTEIVYLSPVRNSDWIIASHSNINSIKQVIKDLRERLLFIFILIWLISTLLIFIVLDLINKKNLNELSNNNRITSERFFSELKLQQNKTKDSIKDDNSKTERLLADKGAKLSPIFIKNIACVITQNKITYIYEHNGDKSTINMPLDELYKIFDKSMFYRVSRQVILSVKSIDKIEKYGNTQLKVTVKPNAPIDIIISKAKLTEFKKWVGKN